MIVRFGSARMTDSSTSSSTTTMTRSAAKAASFWQPSRPQTWVSPAASARWAWTIVDVRAERRDGVHGPVAVRRLDRPDERVRHRQVGLEVAPEREERQVHRARPCTGRPSRSGCTPPARAAPGSASSIRRRIAPSPPTPGIAEPAEDELAGDARGDHLVVDDVRRHAGQGQVAPALADDLVPGREADEVGEALDGHGVAVAHEVGDRVAHRRDLGGAHAGIIAGMGRAGSTSSEAPAGDRGRPRPASWPATSATASPNRRRAVATSAGRDGQRRAHPDARLAALEHEQAALEAAHWTASACSRVSNSMPIMRPLPRTSG